VRRGILQSLPVSCHFRGCKAPLFNCKNDCKRRYTKWLALPLKASYLWFPIRVL